MEMFAEAYGIVGRGKPVKLGREPSTCNPFPSTALVLPDTSVPFKEHLRTCGILHYGFRSFERRERCAQSR